MRVVVVAELSSGLKTASRRRQPSGLSQGTCHAGILSFGVTLKRELIVGSCNVSIDCIR